MTISRMQNPQQLQGIGSLRQPYGLGGFLKKAFRKIKKVAKSPLGKAAILGGLGMWGMGAGPWASGGMWGKAKGAGFLKNLWGAKNIASGPWNMRGVTPGGGGGIGGFAKKWLNPFNKMNPLLYTNQRFSGKKAFGLGAAGLIAAPFIQKAMGYGPYQDEEEEGPDWSVTPSSILNIKNMARARDPSLDFLPSSAYTQSGWYGADGGRAGLLNGGEAGEAQMEQMLRAEYLKYRNQGGTMPYEQFKIIVMQQAQQGQMPNQMMAAGGRAGYLFGDRVEQQTDFLEEPRDDLMASDPDLSDSRNELSLQLFGKELHLLTEEEMEILNDEADRLMSKFMGADGGRAGYQGGELVEQQTDLIEGPQGNEEFQETVVEGQEQPSQEQLEALAMEIFQLPLEELDDQQLLVVYQEAMQGQPMEEAVQEEDVQFAAQGGRMGYQYGGGGNRLSELIKKFNDGTITEEEEIELEMLEEMTPTMAAGGRIGYQYGGDDEDDVLHQNKAMLMYRTRRQEGGLMDLGGQEKDYRDNGGFVALGGEERADDVPARLSKNEFVFTADAVRNAGGGDIDAGSEVMQNIMDNLEQGGEISEESQGLQGGEEIMSEEVIDESNPAQGMYDNYEQLQSRVA